MNKIKKITLMSFLIYAALGLVSCSETESRDLLFFYFESCPSCDEYVMAEEYSELIDKINKSKKWNARHYNLIVPESAEELKKVLKDKGLPDISRSLPLLIVDDQYINGYESIGEKLKELSAENK